MKAVEQFFPVAGTFYYAVQGGSKTFKSVDDKCGNAMQFISVWKVARVDKIPLNHWMFAENPFLPGINVFCSLQWNDAYFKVLLSCTCRTVYCAVCIWEVLCFVVLKKVLTASTLC